MICSLAFPMLSSPRVPESCFQTFPDLWLPIQPFQFGIHFLNSLLSAYSFLLLWQNETFLQWTFVSLQKKKKWSSRYQWMCWSLQELVKWFAGLSPLCPHQITLGWNLLLLLVQLDPTSLCRELNCHESEVRGGDSSTWRKLHTWGKNEWEASVEVWII